MDDRTRAGGFARPAEAGLESPVAVAAALQQGAAMAMVDGAIRRRDVALAFQPVVQGRAMARVAFHEGLLRLFDDSGRIIPARDFIATVEGTEAGRVLDCLALETGLDALARVPGLRLSLNLSARSLAYPRWQETLDRAVSHDPGLAQRLILEIAESSVLALPDIAGHFMRPLQARGIAVALDNFGAGLSSLRLLRDLRFDALKIDGQFVRGVATSVETQDMARALTGLAAALGTFSVAESVESAADAAFLAGIGTDCLQGYAFGAPVLNPAWMPQDGRRRA